MFSTQILTTKNNTMTKHLLKILIIISTSRINKKGLAPLICRVTYKNKRKQFSTGIFINPKNWNSSKQIAEPPNKDTKIINTQLSLIKQNVSQAFLLLQVKNNEFDVEDIYLQFKGEKTTKTTTLLEAFKAHNNKVEKLIGKDYVLATLWKFKQAMELLKGFIKHLYNKNDYQFKDLNMKFITDYEFYLKSEKNLAQSSIYKMIQRFRKIIKIAISEGVLNKDPFALYKCKRPKTVIVFLTTEELQLLEEYNFAQKRLEQVKDMFVFCCYTGLAYQEMSSLKTKHITKGFDGNLWINMLRQKTNQSIAVPLLPKAEEILNKYKKENTEYVLPKISNQKFNSYLKEIASVLGIEKRLTHHIARKTFATTVLLLNGVSMEVVSMLLGHSKITITQEHYAKVVKQKVSNEMNLLKNKFKKL
jgi:integrase/recombinase XerD